MPNKRIKKQFWLSETENQELIRKANLSGLSQTSVIRLLLMNYEPREKPDQRFYETMQQLYAIGNNINQIVRKANSLGFVDVVALEEQLDKLSRFEAKIEAFYLRPVKSQLKWK